MLLLYYTFLVMFVTLLICDCFCYWAASKIDESAMTWISFFSPLSGFWRLFKAVRKINGAKS